jgi:peptide/nickel transport system ATP-binding protein
VKLIKKLIDSDNNTLLKISNLKVEYRLENRTNSAIDGTFLEIPESGYTLGLVGESGSGKTTLGLSVLRMIEPPGRITDGRIEFRGVDVLNMSKEEIREYRWRDVAMVYQSAMNSLNPVARVADPILEVLKVHANIPREEAWKKASSLLSELGLDPSRMKDYPHEFSGGMRQRVVIALALSLSPKLLIADEPTSALDVVVQKQILALLRREVVRKRLSLLFITHDIAILQDIVDNIAVMYAGEVIETGPLDKVLFEPLHPYTEALLNSLLTIDSDEGSLAEKSIGNEREGADAQRETRTITSKALSPGSSAGQALTKDRCRYVSSCIYAFDRCRIEKPELLDVEKGRKVACHKYN